MIHDSALNITWTIGYYNNLIVPLFGVFRHAHQNFRFPWGIRANIFREYNIYFGFGLCFAWTRKYILTRVFPNYSSGLVVVIRYGLLLVCQLLLILVCCTVHDIVVSNRA